LEKACQPAEQAVRVPMRSFILGIVILMAVPAFAVGQQRDRSERSATGRTAVPREEAVQAAPARHTDRRAQPRGETSAPAPRDEKSDDTTPSRERRGTPSAAETVRGRLRDERPQAATARTYRTNSPRIPAGPSSIDLPDHGLRSFTGRERERPGQKDAYYRPRYRRPHSGANVVFVPYAAPVVVVEREVVDEVAGARVIVERRSLARLILDIHPPTAQVFADGYYIGVPEDFRFEDGGAVLEPGPHRIDVLARGYEPVSFDVNLTRGQSATFRHILSPIMRAAQPAPDAAVNAPPAAKQPTTFYLIPGCYMGNVPPKEANLPATCDIARAVSVQY
jgi:hypothetical protein